MLLVGGGNRLLKCVLEVHREGFGRWCTPAAPAWNVAELEELSRLVESEYQGVKHLGGLCVLLNSVGLHVLDELLNHPDGFGSRVDLLPSGPLSPFPSLLLSRLFRGGLFALRAAAYGG